MPAVALGALMIGGSLLQASSARKAAKSQAKAQEQANQQNIAQHTMTPEEKAQYFAQGVERVNRGTVSSMDMAGRGLAARGLGGNQLANPLANIARGRISAIGDVHSNMVQTAMGMRSSTPTLQAADAGPGMGSLFLGNLGGLASGIGSYGGGQYAANKWPKYFAPPKA